MIRELATLDEATLNGSSAEDLKNLFLKQEEPSNETKPAEEPVKDNTEEIKEPEAAIPEKKPEENQTVEQVIDSVAVDKSVDEINYLKKQNEELISLLKNNSNNTNIPKVEKKQLTSEEKLEAFTSDPDAYVKLKVEEILAPQREKLKKIEEEQVFNIARSVSPAFKRLEPVITKLMASNPDYISSHVEPMKRLEGYYLLAEGLEARYLRDKTIEKDEKAKVDQTKAKKAASSLPEPVRKTESKPEKSIEKMTSKELSELIGKYRG